MTTQAVYNEFAKRPADTTYDVSSRAHRGIFGRNFVAADLGWLVENIYDEETNPDGFIIIAWADSMLTDDIWQKKFDAIDWTKLSLTSALRYDDTSSIEETQKCLTKVINKFFRPNSQIKWEELLLVSGLSKGMDAMGGALFEEGDVMLVPSPMFPYYEEFYGARSLVEIAGVPTYNNDGPNGQFVANHSPENYEKVCQELEAKGKTIRAIQIVHPQSPLGIHSPVEEYRQLVNWAVKRGLFVIADECYCGNYFDPDASNPWISISTLFDETTQDALVWGWGISKPFALAGVRCGALHTTNPRIRETLRRFNFDASPNTITQFVARELVGDVDWLENVYFPENHRLILESRDHAIAGLKKLGIPYMTEPKNGWSMMLDLSEYLDEPTFEAEIRLDQHLRANKVVSVRGEWMHSDKPGRYRLAFSSYPPKIITEAMNRIAKTLNEVRAQREKNNNKN